jgi:hypothetical protein
MRAGAAEVRMIRDHERTWDGMEADADRRGRDSRIADRPPKHPQFGSEAACPHLGDPQDAIRPTAAAAYRRAAWDWPSDCPQQALSVSD